MIYRCMKDCTSPAPSRISQRHRRRLAAMIAVLLLAAFLGKSHFCKEVSRETGAGSQVSNVIVASPSEGDFHYFRSGQWLADLRSLVAACRYLLQPDSV